MQQLRHDAERVALLAPLLHYDVADGEFVSSRTPRPVDYPKVPDGVQIFWHLMVHEPINYLDDCLSFDTECVAVGAEARGARSAIDYLTERGTKAALSLNPATRPRDVADLITSVTIVQIMTVEPGGQGHPFQPTLLGKFDEVRAINPFAAIAIDGGANVATLEAIVRAAPAYIAIGSALTQAQSPTDTWQTLNRLVDVTLSQQDRREAS